jgi:hypothetical protein
LLVYLACFGYTHVEHPPTGIGGFLSYKRGRFPHPPRLLILPLERNIVAA